MKVPNGVTYDKIADGCDGMAGKLAGPAPAISAWMLPRVEEEELRRRTDAMEKRAAALEKRAAALEKRAAALEKEIVLLVWAIAAAAAAVAAVLLVCM